MNQRQKNALSNPVPHSRLGEIPHRGRVATIGNRTEILDVREALERKWVWQSSVSFQGSGGGSKPFSMWTKEQAELADKALRRILDGVGDELVLRICPVDFDLEPWPDEHLALWNVIGDPDAAAYMHDWLGMKFPTPPVKFSAMHAWKRLTDAETETVAIVLGGTHV